MTVINKQSPLWPAAERAAKRNLELDEWVVAGPTVWAKRAVEGRFNPNHDDHGRFATGDGGQSDVPVAELSYGGEFYSRFTAGDRAEIQQAANDAVARHPELAGRLSVAFVSSADGSDEQAAEALAHGTVANTSSDDDGHRIMFNDTVAFARGRDQEINTPYGVTTHEVGHAFYAEHGIRWGNAESFLHGSGITPGNVNATTGSTYAAASPNESLAEMYAVAHTPGAEFRDDVSLSGGKIAALYASLENEAREP